MARQPNEYDALAARFNQPRDVVKHDFLCFVMTDKPYVPSYTNEEEWLAATMETIMSIKRSQLAER